MDDPTVGLAYLVQESAALCPISQQLEFWILEAFLFPTQSVFESQPRATVTGRNRQQVMFGQ